MASPQTNPALLDLARRGLAGERRAIARLITLMENRAPEVELPTTMQSTIPGHFEGWGPKARIKLANGQVWQIADDSQAYFNLDNPKVVIRRGMMGGFFLEVEDSNRSPRVRRVQ